MIIPSIVFISIYILFFLYFFQAWLNVWVQDYFWLLPPKFMEVKK